MSGHGPKNNANQIDDNNRQRKAMGCFIGGSVVAVIAGVVGFDISQQDPSTPVMRPDGTTPAVTTAPVTTVTTTETTPTTTTTTETTTPTEADKFRDMAKTIAKQIDTCAVPFFSASGPNGTSQLKFDTTYQQNPQAAALIAQLQAHPDPNLTLNAPQLELQAIDAQGNPQGDPIPAKEPLSDSNIVNNVVSHTPAYIVEIVDSVGVHEANQSPYTVTDKLGCYAIAWQSSDQTFRPYNEASGAFDTSARIDQHITTEG